MRPPASLLGPGVLVCAGIAAMSRVTVHFGSVQHVGASLEESAAGLDLLLVPPIHVYHYVDIGPAEVQVVLALDVTNCAKAAHRYHQGHSIHAQVFFSSYCNTLRLTQRLQCLLRVTQRQ